MCQVEGKFDVRQYKKDLRTRYRHVRDEMPPHKKAEKDAKILERVMNLPEYKNCATLLCYVSTSGEVDTRRLIELSLQNGKNVAVPRCVDGSRDMDFYIINSLNELSPRTFGVLEPAGGNDRLLSDFSRCLCVLPGLVFDMQGYRLGYGGGYYDRFLSSKYSGSTAGVCYSECSVTSMRHGRYDVRCGVLVTDLFVKRTGVMQKHKTNVE